MLSLVIQPSWYYKSGGRRIDILINIAETIIYPGGKNEIGFYIIPYTKINSRWIKEPKYESKSWKHLEKNIFRASE